MCMNENIMMVKPFANKMLLYIGSFIVPNCNYVVLHNLLHIFYMGYCTILSRIYHQSCDSLVFMNLFIIKRM